MENFIILCRRLAAAGLLGASVSGCATKRAVASTMRTVCGFRQSAAGVQGCCRYVRTRGGVARVRILISLR